MANTLDLGTVGFAPMGDYNQNTYYQKLSLVQYNYASYVAKIPSQGVIPTVTTGWQNYWMLLAPNDPNNAKTNMANSFVYSQTFQQNVDIWGELRVRGTTTTVDSETLQVKDKFIVVNSDGDEIDTLAGFVIRIDATTNYGIVYDPTSGLVKLGLGNYVDGEFTFTETAGNVATWQNLVNGNLAVWQASNDRFVDSGIEAKRVADLLPTEGLAYSLSNNGTYAICVGLGTATKKDIIVASEYQGVPVTNIRGNRLGFAGTDITSIFIPDSVTTVQTDAFRECKSLVSVRLSENLTSIANSQFAYCEKLKNVTIPKSVTLINDYAFYGCSSLTSITIPDSVTTIGSSAFYGCSSLTSITIPDSVTTIGNDILGGCSGLTEITSPLPSNNFVDFFDIKEFSNSIKITVNRYPYDDPNQLPFVKDYYLPKDLKKVIVSGDILPSSFNGCSNLTDIIISDGVESIGKYAFESCNIVNLTIPESVSSIGLNAFQHCNKLTTVINKSSLPIKAGEYGIPTTAKVINTVYIEGAVQEGNLIKWSEEKQAFVDSGYSEKVLKTIANDTAIITCDTEANPNALLGAGIYSDWARIDYIKTDNALLSKVFVGNGVTVTDYSGDDHTLRIWVRKNKEGE